ncbi:MULTISPECIES: hypothetical protein [Dyella]|uniref:Uncharacterized protein n=2 Tax=Dyella TaxID=231454 RepID=A0A4R0Z064_9GAMM|nr:MULTISPECIES: hypothetical protein [Dyella]TBR39273.1 hypothetical protein EYV96_03340 [Dyella terrae]TCI13139.1 hypothetical protein EZM97_07525 [Dyella soli]
MTRDKPFVNFDTQVDRIQAVGKRIEKEIDKARKAAHSKDIREIRSEIQWDVTKIIHQLELSAEIIQEAREDMRDLCSQLFEKPPIFVFRSTSYNEDGSIRRTRNWQVNS